MQAAASKPRNAGFEGEDMILERNAHHLVNHVNSSSMKIALSLPQ